MKKLILAVLLVILLWFTFGCQNKAERAEREAFRAQAEIEEQNKALVERVFDHRTSGNRVPASLPSASP